MKPAANYPQRTELITKAESGAESRNVQERSGSSQNAGFKTLGFATTSGQDYEVALCSLIFLRALRLCSDFFLVSNHAQAGKFDDVVLFYRLKGDHGHHKYRAILLQAKHRDRFTQKKLTSSNPFRLKDYLESFKVVRRLSEHPINVESRFIELQEISLVLYTNTGCEIGETAVDVTNMPEVQHLQDFLNTGGRLLRISGAQRAGLPKGEETSDFLDQLVLCTDQMNVEMANRIMEEELSNALKLTSPDVARNLNTEMKRMMKAWWSEGIVRYITAESQEWCKVLEVEILRLNNDTVIIDSQLNFDFTKSYLEEFDVDNRRLKLNWICVRDEYQANAVRTRLFRDQKNSLVIGVNTLNNHLDEVMVLWGNNICSMLVFDMTKDLPEEGSLVLQRLQEAVQSDAGRRLVVIAKGKPTSAGWSEVEAVPTWSVLHQVTRDRILAAPVRLQGKTVALRDVVGSYVSDVMTDEVIDSICVCETEMKLGAPMPAPLEYNLPRCLQRKSTKTLTVDTLTNTNLLIFSSNCLLQENEFRKQFKILNKYEVNRITAIKHSTYVEGIANDYDIRKLCFRFRVKGISGEISFKGLQSDVTEFIPVTWICEEKIVVIEGPPGVGKSSFVTMMCSSVKEQFPEAWVLRLDMGQHTDFIKETDFTEVRHIQQLLVKGLHKDPTNLERRLLEHSLRVTGNVFLFLDAFDEISPDFTSKCCDLLKGISQMIRYRQMIVTTRPVTTKGVEETLQTKTFTLPVYSEEEQVLFLKKFSASRGNYIGEEGISSLRQSAGPALEIPLLCRMAAEVFMHSREQLFLKYQNPWRRVFLYKLFVEQIVINRHAEKFGMEVSVPGTRKLLDYSSKLHLQNLQGLAVRKLMPVDQLPPLSVSTETPEEKLGLVVNTGGRLDFEHQTFAEYFLGCWLACHWQQCPQKLLRDVLFQDGFEFVAVTFTWSLFDGVPLHMAVAQGDEVAVRKHLSPGTTDRGGRTTLHVAAMTQGDHRKVWKLLVTSGEDLNRKDGVLGTTAVNYAEMLRNWEFVDLSLEEIANISHLKFVTTQKAAKAVLIYAVKTDLVCLCQFIWQRDSNINQNLPILHIAAASNSIRVMKLLIEMRYEINEFNLSGFTPLHEASKHGHVEAVTLLVESGADLNIKTEYGYTALTVAAVEGRLEVVKALLEKGAELNIKTEDGNTELMLAAREDRLEVVNKLLETGADINIKNKYGYTALAEAASRGYLEVVKVLLEKGADVNIKTEDGNTAFTLATFKGHLEVVKILSAKGADLNIKKKYGNTALTVAAREGHLEMVKLLLGKGADLNMKNKYGYTALTEAARRGYLETVKLILEKGAEVNIKTEDGNTAFTLAAREGHLEVVIILLEKGADVNVKNKYGDTALTEAARRGYLETVTILLNNGADLNIKTVDGNTAFTLATFKGHQEVVKILLEKGADLHVKNKYGDTALTVAAREGHLEVVKLLLEEGADSNMKNKYDDTALIVASREGHLEVVNMLLEKGADLNTKNKYGYTALTEAARKGYTETVKVLLEKGADVNIKTEDGNTAFSLAAREGHLEIVNMLLEKGADMNIKNKYGDTALTEAARRGYLETVRVLLNEGADLNITTVDGNTAFTLAICEGHLEVMTVLLENGADVNIKTGDGDTELIRAAREGHLEVIKILLENGADLNIRNKHGYTALTEAAQRGYLETVNIILEKGADVNIKTEDGDTAFTLATCEGHLDVVMILLKKGADLNVKTGDGNTELMLAARDGRLEVMKILLENGADLNIKNRYGYTALTLAAREGHLEVVKMLIETGADLNIKNNYGDTALTLAAREGHLEVVNVLLEEGVDIRDMNVDDVLTLAAREGHLGTVKILLENGADFNTKTDYGDTALTRAARGGHVEVVKVLLEKGADINVKTATGNTALTLAATSGHVDVVKVLLETGADFNSKTVTGNTALSLATREGHLDVIKMLLEKEDDSNVTTVAVDTSSSLEAPRSHLEEEEEEEEEIFLDEEASVNAEDFNPEDGGRGLSDTDNRKLCILL